MDLAIVALVFIVNVAGGSAGAYFGAYFREKGKNLATREDIDRITHATEQIKAQISGDLWTKQNRWTFKADTYRRLLEGLSSLEIVFNLLLGLDHSRRVGAPASPENEAKLGRLEDAFYQQHREHLESFWRSVAVARIWLDGAALEALRVLGEKSQARVVPSERSISDEMLTHLSQLIEAVRNARNELTRAAKDDLRLRWGSD
jgi:hypothetical protein